METNKFKYLGYFQTTGGPVCITNASFISQWLGAEYDSSPYWGIIEKGYNDEILSCYDNNFFLFNTETGNFLLFASEIGEIIIAEAIYIEENFSINFSGINFEIHKPLNYSIISTGFLAIFDSSLTIEVPIEYEAFYKIGMDSFFDTAIINCNISKISEVSFKNDNIHLLGVMLHN